MFESQRLVGCRYYFGCPIPPSVADLTIYDLSLNMKTSRTSFPLDGMCWWAFRPSASETESWGADSCVGALRLSLSFRGGERLIRTCHRSNEYHLNCFVYGSEFGCRFNSRMCWSSCARRGGRTESGSPNETLARLTGWRGSTRSGGLEGKFWQDGGGKESLPHTLVDLRSKSAVKPPPHTSNNRGD